MVTSVWCYLTLCCPVWY